MNALPAPAFGQADLSNCEREQIHLAASIQPHGALLVVGEPDGVVLQASANARAFLNLHFDPLGRKLSQVEGDLWERVRPHLADPLSVIPLAVRCRVGSPAMDYDGLLHRPPEGGLVIELEHAGEGADLAVHVERALESILAASSLRGLCDESARLFKDLTGYDRVMVYRFEEAGHGEVFSERREPHLESFLGNRYPASDIPQIARRLYERNRVRVLVDVGYAPVPLVPRQSPLTNADLDMSLCFLRSMSPIHVQYLKNMGVGATLVASLMVGGKLWGLVACHHYAPRFVHYEVRAVCELLAEAIGTRIAALESFVQAQAEMSVRRLEQRMIEAISRDGDWRSALFDTSRSLLQPMNASGAALLFEGQVLTAGEVPGTHQLREIGRWLTERSDDAFVATSSLTIDEPEFAPLAPVASGLVATRVSTSPGEYLLWFRSERVRMVTWGGDPHKPVLIGNSPADLSPRRSFAQWHQLVVGTSEPWTVAELTAARLIGESVADVVLQFRSVRLLIAHDQLSQISRQVHTTAQPVVIIDPEGKLLLSNAAFERMAPGVGNLGAPTELATCFIEEDDVRRNLLELLQYRRAWRGEVTLRGPTGEPVPLLVRGDPVFSSPDRILGFVLLFTDMTEQKRAEEARRHFQEGILDGPRVGSLRLDSKHDLLYRNLLSSVVGNAQLAALEITDGVDLAQMPQMLDSVRASVSRTARLLEYLVWHASRTDKRNQ